MANVPFIIEAKTKGLGAANSKIGKLSGSMKGLTIAATATAVALGVKGLAGALFKIGKSSVDTAAEFEMMKVQLNVLYGSLYPLNLLPYTSFAFVKICVLYLSLTFVPTFLKY